MKILSLLIFCFAFCSNANAQAIKKGAEENNNGAVKSMVYSPKLISNKLPKEVNEQSGMIWYNNLIWIINDSDCPASIFAYNKKGELKSEVKILNAKNHDWESLAEDEGYFYIGDFGNNFGNRKNLNVLKLAKSAIKNGSMQSVKTEMISFEWSDQKIFMKRKHHHNYDCEAFVSYGDSLYFFTKNWANHKTRLYAMSKSTGHHKLLPKDEFDSDLMITGADINPEGNLLALVGYKNFRTYMYLFGIDKGKPLLSGKHVKLDLQSLGSAQTEGVMFDAENKLYISTEETRKPQALYQIDWQQWESLLR